MVIGTPNPMYYPKMMTPAINYGVHPAMAAASIGQFTPYYPYPAQNYSHPGYQPYNAYGRYVVIFSYQIIFYSIFILPFINS